MEAQTQLHPTDNNINQDIYKAYACKEPAYANNRAYYIRLTAGNGINRKSLYNRFYQFTRKYAVSYGGVISNGHGRLNRPHIHALIIADKPLTIQEVNSFFGEHIDAKHKRISSDEELKEYKRYIREHVPPNKDGRLIGDLDSIKLNAGSSCGNAQQNNGSKPLMHDGGSVKRLPIEIKAYPKGKQITLGIKFNPEVIRSNNGAYYVTLTKDELEILVERLKQLLRENG